LYRTRIKTPETRLASITPGDRHSTPATKKINQRKRKDKSLLKQNSKNRKPSNEHSNEKAPHHQVQDVSNLSTQESQIALDYWINQFNFPYASCDESIYPDEQRKIQLPSAIMTHNQKDRLNSPE
jgi:hypothetical protein